MFKITSGKGFHITFANGVVASVQFGPGNYCDNYNADDWDAPQKVETWKSQDAEVAFFWDTGPKEARNWCTRQVYEAAGLGEAGDDVLANVSPEDLLKLLNAAANLVRT